MDVGKVIQGHWNELLGQNSNLSESRMNICQQCPIYSSRFGGLCNNRLWLNQETGDISTVKKDGYKNGCGCRLNAKTRLVNASCPLGKW